MIEPPRIAVVGAGVIGAGVAHALAERGRDVLLLDRDEAALDRARASIRAGARLARLQRRGPVDASGAGDLLARIRFTTEWSGLDAVDVVIENVTEDLETKLAVHRELDARCTGECVFAANTSAIPMAKIAAATRRPERLVGLHFMNPVPPSAMVEVVRGARTSEATLRRVAELLGAMGRTSSSSTTRPAS